MDVAVLNISSAFHGQLVRMLITNEPHGTFICLDQIAYFLFKHDMQSCNEATNVEISLKSQYLF